MFTARLFRLNGRWRCLEHCRALATLMITEYLMLMTIYKSTLKVFNSKDGLSIDPAIGD